ncbi:MAG TPA: hypothetical protein VN698_12560 [Bacteroidia bacterium]|nr:hypothetical protein [Bacteroidia bacterium]
MALTYQKWVVEYTTNGSPGSVPLLQYYSLYLTAKLAGDAVLNNSTTYPNIIHYEVKEVYTL